MRRLATLLALLPLVACSGEDHQPEPSPEPVHWRLVWTEDPQHRVLVAWTTFLPDGPHEVHLASAADGPASRVVPASANGRYSGIVTTVCYYHHAELADLEPDTTYWLWLESSGHSTRRLHFRTAPADDQSFSILSGGDSRSDPKTRRAMNRQIAALTDAYPEILALAHGGDYVYSGQLLPLWMQWLSDHEFTTAESGRVLPLIPARGNHEFAGPLFDQVFGWPGGGLGRNYYATRLSPEVTLVTLNTERAAGDDQLEFLRATLTEDRERRWRVAQYHRPIWPAVKGPSFAKPLWQPVFDELGVNLVLESDGHVLKRTVPILGEERDPKGVVYIGEGGLGVAQRTPDAGRWYLQPPGHTQSGYHVWKVDFGSTRIGVQAIGIDGTVLDRAEIGSRR